VSRWWIVAAVLGWGIGPAWWAAEVATGSATVPATAASAVPATATAPALGETQRVLQRFLEAYIQGDAAAMRQTLDFAPAGDPKNAGQEAAFDVVIAPQLAQIALWRAAAAKFPGEDGLKDLLPLEDPRPAIEKQLVQVAAMAEFVDAGGDTATLLLPPGQEEKAVGQGMRFKRNMAGEWRIVAGGFVETISAEECRARSAGSQAAVKIFNEIRADLEAGKIATVEELVKKIQGGMEELLNPATEPAATQPATRER